MGKIMLNGTQYGVGGIEQAKDISYDNTESGATATDVQGALDELSAGLAIEYFTLPNSLNVAHFYGYGVYFPASKTVIINITVASSSNIGMTSTITVIPEEYRPTTAKTGGCMIKNSDSLVGSGAINIATDGRVAQGTTNTMRNLISTIIYVID